MLQLIRQDHESEAQPLYPGGRQEGEQSQTSSKHGPAHLPYVSSFTVAPLPCLSLRNLICDMRIIMYIFAVMIYDDICKMPSVCLAPRSHHDNYCSWGHAVTMITTAPGATQSP